MINIFDVWIFSKDGFFSVAQNETENLQMETALKISGKKGKLIYGESPTTKLKTMVLKFVKKDYDENFEKECNSEIDDLCILFGFELTKFSFSERTNTLTATLRKKAKVELVIK